SRGRAAGITGLASAWSSTSTRRAAGASPATSRSSASPDARRLQGRESAPRHSGPVSTEPVIRARGLVKHYGPFEAVKGSFGAVGQVALLSSRLRRRPWAAAGHLLAERLARAERRDGRCRNGD